MTMKGVFVQYRLFLCSCMNDCISLGERTFASQTPIFRGC